MQPKSIRGSSLQNYDEERTKFRPDKQCCGDEHYCHINGQGRLKVELLEMCGGERNQ